MEYFGALPGKPIEECLRAVRRSDIYLGVIGTRYGSTDAQGVSITQCEYEEAYQDRKTILIYLLDEEHHAVLPKFVDRGNLAEKLNSFKELLRTRHVCATFSSPQDLAVKIGIDLIRHIDRVDNNDTNSRIENFAAEMPKFLASAGYALGMGEHAFDLSHLLKLEGKDNVRITDSAMKDIIVAGYIALNLSRENYGVLRGIVTFDKNFWQLLTSLVKHFGVNEGSMAKFLEHCKDPLHFRLLTVLAGELRLRACVEPICKGFLGPPNLDKRFNEYREQVTPLKDIVKYSLQAMPMDVLPILEEYSEIAKARKRWQQKQLFEAAAAQMRNRTLRRNKPA